MCDLGEDRYPSAKRHQSTPLPPSRYATPEKRSRAIIERKSNGKIEKEKKRAKTPPIRQPAPYTPLLMYAPVAKKYIQLNALELSSSQAKQVASEEPIHRLAVEAPDTFAIRQSRSVMLRFLNAADPRFRVVCDGC